MSMGFSQKPEKGSTMKNTRTVILWGREDMLTKGVGVFLNARKGWEVARITDTCNIDFLYQEVERVRPDVVIIYQGDYASETDVPARLMANHPGMKVIIVSLETNSVEVYNKQSVLVKEVSDLFSIVDD